MGNGIFNKITGKCGEDFAAQYLKLHGYKILEQNYRNKIGEIDIIAKRKKTLVFVEVKTRKSSEFGTPAEAVTYYKKQKIVNTARYYLAKNPTDMDISFDVIEVFGSFDGVQFELFDINHLQYVFEEV